jgi:guanine deaminase
LDEMKFMRRAIQLACDGVDSGGGPFGAVVVRNGEIIGEGLNQVVPTGDPTSHAEIVAIRAACKSIGSHVLDNTTIYTSGEPCPMCLGAVWWARIGEVVYGNNLHDAAAIGFDDSAIYAEMALPLEKRTLLIRRLGAGEALEAYKRWLSKSDRIHY